MIWQWDIEQGGLDVRSNSLGRIKAFSPALGGQAWVGVLRHSKNDVSVEKAGITVVPVVRI